MTTFLITLFAVVSIAIITFGIVMAVDMNNLINAEVDEAWRKQ